MLYLKRMPRQLRRVLTNAKSSFLCAPFSSAQAPIIPLQCLYLLCFPQAPQVSRYIVTHETFLCERTPPPRSEVFAFYPSLHLHLKESSSYGQWASSYLLIQTSVAD